MRPIEVGEEIVPAEWADLPSDDRVMVGGRTVWVGPFDGPVVVAQPNRWGQVEDEFPAASCIVESDPLVAALLPQPLQVEGWVDRLHRPIQRPTATAPGAELIATTVRLAKMLDQIKGVHLIEVPRGRTVAFTTPREAADLVDECRAEVVGLRPLPGIAGGLAVALRPYHREDDLKAIFAALARTTDPPTSYRSGR